MRASGRKANSGASGTGTRRFEHLQICNHMCLGLRWNLGLYTALSISAACFNLLCQDAQSSVNVLFKQRDGSCVYIIWLITFIGQSTRNMEFTLFRFLIYTLKGI
ncbi:unnamed protein product [Acanthoscelides obtectus]|uniref:Uncharacterized protein n=1 Tax=Acanthoscelides obtectus TaxID=200917 RepID=A0A9P0KC30_ACAOB|nr:unnamed protein product [Acanthoscelides obtectus]CAK1623064.1 hypothetical protein AOBTE_LOCUS1796 [Acanthoscelides obtectus]